jgi:hypothetical protein
MNNIKFAESVERWGMFEVSVPGKTAGNPFTDYYITGVFRHKNETVETGGFYDGNGIYKVRFMPSFEGIYTFEVSGTFASEAISGSFDVTPAKGNNHGPVRVAGKYHFAYEDGAPYYPIGTTCYVWTHQSKELRDKTIESLKNNAFNKIRFCIFPKHYLYNLHDPETYPYEGTPCDSSALNEDNFEGDFVWETLWKSNDWDFTKFNPGHFQRFESYIAELMDMGVQADIIVMHPYDRWRFQDMGKEADDLYWKYVISRFSAYRNVWWSLANEYDFMPRKTLSDWERYASILCAKDPYNRLRSIHNGFTLYDHSRPWVTHVSYQGGAENTNTLRERYGKPVVLDEICYEGNIAPGWGNIDGQELVRRFWDAVCRGGYPGHGETYIQPDGKLWWSHGGELLGESPERIKFLYKIMAETPGYGLRTNYNPWDFSFAVPETGGGYYIAYFGNSQPKSRDLYFDGTAEYKVEVIDTWEMTVTDAGIHKGKMRVELPGKRYMAIRAIKI